ncbi:MAG: hypothetical protein ACRDKW_17045 [Actinomycetota bacterium]
MSPVTPTCPDAPPDVMPQRRPGPPNRLIVLDRAWAERLGVERREGRYTIRRSELMERLAGLQRMQARRAELVGRR